MPLINTKGIIYHLGRVDGHDEWLSRKKDIDEIPTVDAIPVEWLEQWEEQHKEDPCYCNIISEEILRDWREEVPHKDIFPNCVQHAKAMGDIEEKLKKKMAKYNHTHCLICGEYKDLSDGTPMHDYICKECMSSFPIEYINFRLDCYEKGIWLKQFNNLEMRLAGMKLDEEDLYEREHTWNWDEEDESDI